MPKKQTDSDVVAEALADYQDSKLTTAEIAAKHGVSTAALTVWAKKNGVPLRNRGRKMLEHPTPRHAEVLRLHQNKFTYAAIGLRVGMAKQAVHRIVKRWRRWESPAPSYAPGDVVVWRKRKFVVLEADSVKGVLREYGTRRVYRDFVWSVTRMPKKVGRLKAA